MAKSSPDKDIELHPDAWKRFERAAGVVAKTPPQHRSKQSDTVTPKRPKAQPKKSEKSKARKG